MAIGFLLVSALITTRPAMAATSVGGIIAQDTTWTKDGSPYIVTGNILVFNGVTLAIEPGVQVRLDGSYGIYVEGKLQAIGTEAENIVFTSNKSTPAAGDWGAIRFFPISVDAIVDNAGNYVSGSVISFAEISYGRGVQATGSSPYFSDLYIHHVDGVAPWSWWADQGANGAIWLGSSNAIVKNTRIENNACWGMVILLQDAFVENNTMLAENNIIRKNRSGGIFLQGGPGPWYHNGLRFHSIIRDNLISDNTAGSGSGIFIDSGMHLIEGNCIVRNITRSNGSVIDTALYSTSESTIRQNEIRSNQGDSTIHFRLPSPLAVITQNNIRANQTHYDIDVEVEFFQRTIGASRNLNATSNFWGGLNSSQVAARVHDFQDDIFVPRVSTDPLLETKVKVPGCALLANVDSDQDGTPDNTDGCLDDPAKTQAGVCGCGVADSDINLNGVMDCFDPILSSYTTPLAPKVTLSPYKVRVRMQQFGNVQYQVTFERVTTDNQKTTKVFRTASSVLWVNKSKLGRGTWRVKYQVIVGTENITKTRSSKARTFENRQ